MSTPNASITVPGSNLNQALIGYCSGVEAPGCALKSEGGTLSSELRQATTWLSARVLLKMQDPRAGKYYPASVSIQIQSLTKLALATMTSEVQHQPPSPDGTSAATLPPPEAAEQPYSIFDKRQKALVVVIISIAATCEWETPSKHGEFGV